MITARHVPGLTFELMGTIYTATHRVNHPTYDIAIFNFATDLPVWCNLGYSVNIGDPVVLVGYGGVGYVNNQWHGYDIRYGNHGRHAAGNTVDHRANYFNLGPALIMMLRNYPDAATVNGDSGGACMSNGRLVGVISYAFNMTGGQLPNYGFAVNNGGTPYHGSGAIDLTQLDVQVWVRTHMKRALHQTSP